MKKKLWLFKELRKHRSLSNKRTIDFNRNKVAKWLMYIGGTVMVVYMLFIAFTLSLIANDLKTITTVEFILGAVPVIAIVDFFFRFLAQQTPSQIVKPYVLLPIPKYTCIDFFILGQMLDSSNLIWFILLVPYCIMSVFFSYGLMTCIAILLFYYLMVLCVSQFYLIVRTFINDSMVFWIIPLVSIAMLFVPGLQGINLANYDFDAFFGFYNHIGGLIGKGNITPYLLLIGLFIILALINRQVQYRHVMSELSKTAKVEKHKSVQMNWLNRLGQLGLYLKLEILTALRNKNPRKSFIAGVSIIVMFSLVIIFTDVYDSNYMSNFWCMYDYTIFGAMTLVKILCPEGNFIDGIMVRREQMLQMLRAKYFFNVIILIVPFLLMLPTVLSGKWPFMMIFSYMVFTAGFQYFIMFQLAVYNRTTTPLNTKFIAKSNIENGAFQIIAELFCLFVPVVLVSILEVTMGKTAAYFIMFFIGMVFIITHKIWLRNIYNRFMKRKYVNLEGFRSTR